MVTVLALVTIAVGICAGFVAPPSVHWVLALGGADRRRPNGRDQMVDAGHR